MRERDLRTERVGELKALSAKAGIAYAVTVFAIGFLLGAARILLLAPRAGSTVAVRSTQKSRTQRQVVAAQMPDCEPPPRERVAHEFEDEKLPYDEAA